MTKVIRCVGLAGTTQTGQGAPVGAYLVEYDPDAHDGRGGATWTEHLMWARRFDDAAAALEFWRQPSTVRPTREDGEPNRPLTAFTVEVGDGPAALTKVHVDEVCRPGQQGLTCAFAVVGGDGYECSKGTGIEVTIRQRMALGTMVSKGDNCEGRVGAVSR